MKTKTEEEIERGCGKRFDINDPNYITFCGVTAHTSKDYEIELCERCKGKLQGYRLAKEEFNKKVKKLKNRWKYMPQIIEEIDEIFGEEK